MKKVLFVTPHFLPRIGGVEKHVAEVSKILAKKDWSITVLTVQESEDQALLEKLPFCKVVRIPLDSQKNKVSLWKWIDNYFDSNYKDGIIHVHDVGWWLLVRRLRQKNRFFITFHGWEGEYPVRWQAKLHRLIIARLSQGTIHVGEFIQRFYWDKPNKITYGGTTVGIEHKPAQLDKQRIRITFLGRLEKENNIEQYVMALGELAKKNIKVEMTWVGDGALKTVCEKWGTVTGMVEDVRPQLRSSDFVFANSYLSILEAQSEGKIVCALYDHDLKKTYLQTFPGKETMLIEKDPNQLAIKIEALTDDQQRYKALCKETYHFSHSQTWATVATLYEQLWSKA